LYFNDASFCSSPDDAAETQMHHAAITTPYRRIMAGSLIDFDDSRLGFTFAGDKRIAMRGIACTALGNHRALNRGRS
jgi:hypothetical protein